MEQTQSPQQVVYQADQAEVQTLRNLRSKVHGVGSLHKNRHVRVRTIDGHVYEGSMVHVEGCMLYLSVQPEMDSRFFYPHQYYPPFFYYNTIVPLVLYDLLAITLL